MAQHQIVTREEWLSARQALMSKEKAFTKARDDLSRERQSLPWVQIDTPYVFEGIDGPKSLSDLFDGRSQLVVYHFMFGADWDEGCPSCSFWADNYNGIIPHLNARDVSLVAISTAAIEKLVAYRQRLGWSFKWLSAAGNTFNQDFGVSFSEGDLAKESSNYNFGTQRFNGPEAAGLSFFIKDEDGSIYHSYSTYARGLDMFNTAYHYLDAVPKGRDEDGLPFTMAWLKRRDSY